MKGRNSAATHRGVVGHASDRVSRVDHVGSFGAADRNNMEEAAFSMARGRIRCRDRGVRKRECLVAHREPRCGGVPCICAVRFWTKVMLS